MIRLNTLLNYCVDDSDFNPLDLFQSVEIHGLCRDSRFVQSGDLFFALFSKRTHEINFHHIEEALSKGAAAVLVESRESFDFFEMKNGIPFVYYRKMNRAMGRIADLFYGYPSKAFPIFGVTGTNGKTSTVHFLAQLLTLLDYRVGSIGTLGSGFFGALSETGFTTPGALSLQQTLPHFEKQKADAVVMEVPSHGIQEERICGVSFSVGGFTNLSQDHLDFHGDMETYAKVKERFFTEDWTSQVVINGDDETGIRYLKQLQKEGISKPVCVYGFHLHDLPQLENSNAVRGKIESWQPDSFVLSIESKWGKGSCSIPLCGGLFQASNVLLAVSMLLQFGLPFESLLQLLPQLKSVQGRMELVNVGQPFSVVVDYAHTKDALEKALLSLRPQCKGKLWCVFGCGGDRDASKRPEMARIAEIHADEVVVTSDNPRHESAEKIMEEIQAGFQNPASVKKILDRREAIQYAVQRLSENDVLLVAGKGAEGYQQVGDEKIPYSDVEWVRNVLQDLNF